MHAGWLTAIINLLLGDSGPAPTPSAVRTICGLKAQYREYNLTAEPRTYPLKAEYRTYDFSAEGCEC